MWCLISQPNSVVFEVRIDPKAIGQECLEKVCEFLGISSESDYFGLKYENSKGEELWLNLRNPIDRQVNYHHYHGHTTPLRLQLRVKFWVPPHLLLQENTRHQFYLNAKLDLLEKRLFPNNWESLSKIIALIAQAEVGDCTQFNLNNNNIYNQYSTISVNDNNNNNNNNNGEDEDDDEEEEEQQPRNLLYNIMTEHRQLVGMKNATAEYWLLKEITEYELFGTEMFFSKCQNNNKFGIGPQGITIFDNNKNNNNDGNNKQLISFNNIISASSHRRTFRLCYLSPSNDNNNKEKQLIIKLDSNHIANSLYRSITEKHAFYSCETVRSVVTSQFIRDLKGTIVSIFNEDSTLGKKYVFDIRRTCREVYDNARRLLYQENQSQNCINNNNNERTNGDQDNNSQERLTRLLDAMTCKICMDNQIDAVFLPCAHVVACTLCASKCDRCPLCRSDISQAQKLYLPGEFRQIIS